MYFIPQSMVFSWQIQICVSSLWWNSPILLCLSHRLAADAATCVESFQVDFFRPSSSSFFFCCRFPLCRSFTFFLAFLLENSALASCARLYHPRNPSVWMTMLYHKKHCNHRILCFCFCNAALYLKHSDIISFFPLSFRFHSQSTVSILYFSRADFLRLNRSSYSVIIVARISSEFFIWPY